MTPRLPTELLAHILAFACEDEPGLIRRRTRDTFSLVCHDWCCAVDRGSQVLINEVDELSRVVVWLSGGARRPLGSKEGTRIKSIYLKLTKTVGRARADPRQAQEINKLFKLVDGLESLELELSSDVLSTKPWYEGNLNRLAPRSLAHLTSVKSLSITGFRLDSRLTFVLDDFEA